MTERLDTVAKGSVTDFAAIAGSTEGKIATGGTEGTGTESKTVPVTPGTTAAKTPRGHLNAVRSAGHALGTGSCVRENVTTGAEVGNTTRMDETAYGFCKVAVNICVDTTAFAGVSGFISTSRSKHSLRVFIAARIVALSKLLSSFLIGIGYSI